MVQWREDPSGPQSWVSASPPHVGGLWGEEERGSSEMCAHVQAAPSSSLPPVPLENSMFPWLSAGDTSGRAPTRLLCIHRAKCPGLSASRPNCIHL